MSSHRILRKLMTVGMVTTALLSNMSAGYSEEIVPGGSFNILINRDIDSFDNTKSPSPDLARLQVLFAVHETLFRYHPDTGELEPRLAQSVKHNDTFTEWDVSLRPDVRFSNGEQLTSEAYVHHFERLMASPMANSFWAYAGFKPTSVEAVDDLTVRFKLESPVVAFDTILGYPLYIWSLNEPGFAKANENDPEYGRQAVGAGPYMLKEWVPGSKITLVKNPNYWNPDEQIADELTFVVITGPERGANWAALQAGDVDIDWTSGDLAAWGKTQTDFNFDLGFRSSSGLMYAFNATQPPFDDLRVRRAFAHAINREAVVGIVYKGGQTVADQAFPPGTKWYCEELEVPQYDPELARAELAEYGKPLPKIEILALTGPFEAAAEVIQGMLRDVGVEAEITNAGTSPAQLNATVSQGQSQSWITLGGVTVHPTTFQGNLASGSPANVWGMASENIDLALKQLGEARTEEEIKAAHCAFEQAKLDEVPFIYMTYNIAGIFSKKDINGINPPQTELLGLTGVYRTQ